MAYVRPGVTTATHRSGTDESRRALLFGNSTSAASGGGGGGGSAGGGVGPGGRPPAGGGGRYPLVAGAGGGGGGAGGSAVTEQMEQDNAVRVDRLTGGVQALKEVRFRGGPVVVLPGDAARVPAGGVGGVGRGSGQGGVANGAWRGGVGRAHMCAPRTADDGRRTR